MNYGGDAADQIVRYSLEGTEIALKLTGEAAKNFAVFAAAVLKDQKKMHDGQYSRNAYTPQSYCATYVAAKKYGLNVSSFSFERVCQLCSGLEPQVQRRFLSDAKQAAYTVERIVRRGLREMELSVTPEAAYSVEQAGGTPEQRKAKTGKSKKQVQPERE